MSYDQHFDAWSRRQLLQRVGATGLAVAAGGVLAACGSDDESEAGGSGGPASSAVGKKINALVGPGGKDAGQGLTLPVGAVLALSGPGSYYGRVQSRGAELAVEHIKAAGGPSFELQMKDHRSGDPKAGAAVTRELGLDRVPVSLPSYLAVFGAMLPGMEQYKIFGLDGGGGTGQLFRAKPFFYGTRASWPDDTFPGIFRYVAERKPDIKTVALVVWDIGKPFTDAVRTLLQAQLDRHGLSLVAVEPVKIGTTDYANTLARLKQASPHAVVLATGGTDNGYFLKGFQSSGIDAQVIGTEYTPDAVEIGGDAYEGYWFSFDFFDARKPPNQWGELFAAEYRKKYKEDAFFYAANYYENTFALWELVRRILKAGDDVESGEAFDQHLQADPVFKSVYGGDAKSIGDFAIDKKTHSVSRRGMSLQEVRNGQPTELASFGIGGADFQVVD